MHEESRETLIRDLVGLLEVGRDNLDMLVITPRRTLHGLIVMVEAAKLRSVGQTFARRVGTIIMMVAVLATPTVVG